MDSAKSCMNQAVEKLEEMGWDKGSIKGMGGCLSWSTSSPTALPVQLLNPV